MEYLPKRAESIGLNGPWLDLTHHWRLSGFMVSQHWSQSVHFWSSCEWSMEYPSGICGIPVGYPWDICEVHGIHSMRGMGLMESVRGFPAAQFSLQYFWRTPPCTKLSVVVDQSASGPTPTDARGVGRERGTWCFIRAGKRPGLSTRPGLGFQRFFFEFHWIPLKFKTKHGIELNFHEILNLT